MNIPDKAYNTLLISYFRERFSRSDHSGVEYDFILGTQSKKNKYENCENVPVRGRGGCRNSLNISMEGGIIAEFPRKKFFFGHFLAWEYLKSQKGQHFLGVRGV